MKARIDRTRKGRVWERPRQIQICKEDGTRMAVINLSKFSNMISISHTPELEIKTHQLNGMGSISMKAEETKG